MEMRTIHKEEKEPLSATQLQDEVTHLKSMLAEKEEQLRRAVSRRQLRRLAQHENMALLSRTEADLKSSQKKCADVEMLIRGTASRQDPKGRDGYSGGHTEALEMFHEELSKKTRALRERFLVKQEQTEDQMWQRLAVVEEDFVKRLVEERKKNEQELMEKERRVRQECEEYQERNEKKLSVYRQAWERRVWKWETEKSELIERIKEQVNLRERQEEENGQEAERLKAEIQQLQPKGKKNKEKKKELLARIQKLCEK